MKANANIKSKTKNSFIYFQLGLIATMLITLFVLEYQFKTVKSKPAIVEVFSPSDDIWDVTNITIIKETPAETKVETKVVKPAPRVTPIDKVNVVKNEVPKENNNLPTESPTDTQPVETPTQNPVATQPSNTGGTSKVYNEFSVEQLPMFPACKGLSKAEQKACFEEQLYKAINRNLEYPEEDLLDNKQGTAIIEFVIDENGAITNVKALDNRRATIAMQKASEKAVKKLPKLIPAKQGDNSVKIKYTIPITFKIK